MKLGVLLFCGALLQAQTSVPQPKFDAARREIDLGNYNKAGLQVMVLADLVKQQLGRDLEKGRLGASMTAGRASTIESTTALLDAARRSWADNELEKALFELRSTHSSLYNLELGVQPEVRYTRDLAATQSGSPVDLHQAARSAIEANRGLDAIPLLDREIAYWRKTANPLALNRAITLKGIAYLSASDTPHAIEALMASIAQAPVPPRNRNSPTMALAQKLLSAGQKATVLEFLTKCEAWNWPDGTATIANWKAEITAGRKPSFNVAQLSY